MQCWAPKDVDGTMLSGEKVHKPVGVLAAEATCDSDSVWQTLSRLYVWKT